MIDLTEFVIGMSDDKLIDLADACRVEIQARRAMALQDADAARQKADKATSRSVVLSAALGEEQETKLHPENEIGAAPAETTTTKPAETYGANRKAKRTATRKKKATGDSFLKSVRKACKPTASRKGRK